MTVLILPENEEPVAAVPTQEEIDTAHQEKLAAWLAYVTADTGKEDLWAAFAGAIEKHAALQFYRNQAMLKEYGTCSI